MQFADRSRAAFADRTGKRARVAKPVTAAMLSSILPGTGEWYAGARRRAGLGWLVSFGLVGAVMIRLAGEPAVRLVVQPDVVVFLMAANGAMLLFRAGSAIDAYQVAVDALPARRAAQFRPAVTAVALVSLLSVTAAPHLVIAYYGLSALDFLTGVFVDEKADEVVAAAPPRRRLPPQRLPRRGLAPRRPHRSLAYPSWSCPKCGIRRSPTLRRSPHSPNDTIESPSCSSAATPARAVAACAPTP